MRADLRSQKSADIFDPGENVYSLSSDINNKLTVSGFAFSLILSG